MIPPGEGRKVNKGSYVVVFRVEKPLKILRPSESTLKPGLYAYVGSAMNSLTGRVKRHLEGPKKVHWHVDQLSISSEVELVLMFPGKQLEKELSRFFSKHFEVVKGFGNSDIGGEGNLFLLPTLPDLLEALRDFLKKEKEKWQ